MIPFRNDYAQILGMENSAVGEDQMREVSRRHHVWDRSRNAARPNRMKDIVLLSTRTQVRLQLMAQVKVLSLPYYRATSLGSLYENLAMRRGLPLSAH
jgi:hypothetical protein